MLAMRLVAVSGTRPLRCGMSAPRDWPCAEAGEPGWVGGHDVLVAEHNLVGRRGQARDRGEREIREDAAFP